MDTIQTQQSFFNHIKSKLPLHLSLVDEVAEVLNISNDSAYRRIRGEKPISMDEIQVLCNKYQVSIDQLLHMKSNTVIFSGNKVDRLTFGFDDWLQDIENNLKLITALPNSKFFSFAKDIHIFHYMQFPELCAFKFFFLKRTIMGYTELSKQQFDGEKTEDVPDLAKRIIELYTQVPSVEIWSEESVNITIRQIEFYRQSNIFADKQILLKVYAQLEELLNHIEHQAEIGKKFLYGHPIPQIAAPFDIYRNEVLIGDNSIYVKAGERQITFLFHNGVNFTATEDKSFCDYTYKYLQNIISKSTHISLVGEKERSMFFNTLRGKIYEYSKNIT